MSVVVLKKKQIKVTNPDCLSSIVSHALVKVDSLFLWQGECWIHSGYIRKDVYLLNLSHQSSGAISKQQLFLTSHAMVVCCGSCLFWCLGGEKGLACTVWPYIPVSLMTRASGAPHTRPTVRKKHILCLIALLWLINLTNFRGLISIGCPLIM